MTINNKIKVLQIIHSMHIGGAEKVVADIAQNINSEVFEVEVCCIKEEGVLADEIKKSGGVVRALPYEKKNFSNIVRGLSQVIEESQPDIIHTHGDVALIDIGPLLIFKKLPKVIHTYHFGNYPHIKKRYLLASVLFSQFPDKLISVSDHQQKNVIKYLRAPRNKISTIVNGVNSNPYIHEELSINEITREGFANDSDLIVGSVAVLTKQKGIPFLLEAILQISKERTNIKFIIAGGGPLEDELRAQAVELGISEIVHFTGWRSDALKFMNVFDIFIMPSLWEALPIVLLEALASRKTIITTDVGDNSKIIEHMTNGVLIPPKDPQAITDAILKLADDPSLREAMRKHAYDSYINNYTSKKMIEAYEGEYRKLMDQQ